MTPHRPSAYLVLIIGIIACSSAVIMIKLSSLPPALLAASRLLLAALILLPIYGRERKKHPTPPSQTTRFSLFATLLPAFLLALHFMVWNQGVNQTSSAHATLIVNMGPLATPILIWFMFRDRLNGWEYAGTAVGLLGVSLLSQNDLHLDKTKFFGDVLCFIAMIFGTTYFVLARRFGTKGSIWLYLTPIYAVAGSFCLIAAFLMGESFQTWLRLREWIPILGLTLIPTLIGHSAINHSMRILHPQLVSVSMLAQFIFAGILGYTLLDEKITPIFIPAAGLVCIGASLAIFGHYKRSTK